VNLSWSTPLGNGGSAIKGYNVYRSTSSGTETLLTNLGVVNSYSDTDVTNGTPYYYEVTAVNGVGESVRSTEASATPTTAGASVPGAPRSVAAQTAPFLSKGVTLSWRAPASNGGAAINGYRIYRGTHSGQDTLYTSVTCTSTSCSTTDSNTTSGTTYYYKVAAFNSVGTGSVSTQVSAKAR
jgi:fibronectin type 3 domain-containing protein